MRQSQTQIKALSKLRNLKANKIRVDRKIATSKLKE